MHGPYPEHVIYLFTYNAFTLSPHLTLSAMHTITTVMYKPIVRYIRRLYVSVQRHAVYLGSLQEEEEEDRHFAILLYKCIYILLVNYSRHVVLEFPFAQHTKTFSHNDFCSFNTRCCAKTKIITRTLSTTTAAAANARLFRNAPKCAFILMCTLSVRQCNATYSFIKDHGKLEMLIRRTSTCLCGVDYGTYLNV